MLLSSKVSPHDAQGRPVPTKKTILPSIRRMKSGALSLATRAIARKDSSSMNDEYQVPKVKEKSRSSDRGWRSWPVIATVRPWAQLYLLSVKAQMCMVLLAGLSCAIYVFSTYLSGMGLRPYLDGLQQGGYWTSEGENSNDDSSRDALLSTAGGLFVLVLFLIDQLTNLCFIGDYALSCIGSDHLWRYVSSPIGVADLFSGIPVSMIVLNSQAAQIGNWGFTRVLKFLKVV
jgi:hypothetical protein